MPSDLLRKRTPTIVQTRNLAAAAFAGLLFASTAQAQTVETPIGKLNFETPSAAAAQRRPVDGCGRDRAPGGIRDDADAARAPVKKGRGNPALTICKILPIGPSRQFSI